MEVFYSSLGLLKRNCIYIWLSDAYLLGENVSIGEYMYLQHDFDSDCFKAGTSTHNQRIERLWGDTNRGITEFYWVLFTELSDTHHVDFENESHVYIIHHLFLDCINEDLQSFKLMWNNHKLRTEHNKTPNQLLLENMELSQSKPPVAMPSLSEDDEDRVDNNSDDLNQVILEPIKCPLNEELRIIFENRIPKFVLADMDTTYKEPMLTRIAEAFRVFDEIISNHL